MRTTFLSVEGTRSEAWPALGAAAKPSTVYKTLCLLQSSSIPQQATTLEAPMESSYLSYLGSLMGLIAILDRLIPRSVWIIVERKMYRLLGWLTWHTEVCIHEFESGNSNEVYELAHLHVSHLTSDRRRHTARRLRLSQLKNASKPSYNPEKGQPIEETFGGAIFRWELHIDYPDNSGGGRGYYFDKSGGIRRQYMVTTHERYKYTVLPLYMDHVIEHGRKLRHQTRDRKLFTNIRSEGWEYKRRLWRNVPFKHASTFDSIALPEETKQLVRDDLDAFMAGEDFFRSVGRAWKRGYLLFGPPGTGKSSLIAAIANYTQFDVYDLELTEVKSNANLRELLMGVSNKSIIVIEDIDCSLELKKRGKPAPDVEGDSEQKKDDPEQKKPKEEDEKSRVTLSGLLNFIDGLWSCIGDERIIIFTTNHKEKLDPALLRSGRMDLHILMSFCGPEAFRTLARTHLRITRHRLFGQIEELLAVVEITPADVAEILIRNRYDSDAALEQIVKALTEAADKRRVEDAKDDLVNPALTEPIVAV